MIVSVDDCINPGWYAPVDIKVRNHNLYNCDLHMPLKTITLNDLVDVIPFRRAYMKMDIEGMEWRAIRQAERLFAEVDIERVYMEWEWYSRQHQIHPVLGPGVIEFFTRHRYVPRHVGGDVIGDALDTQLWGEWPSDVVWVKSKVTDEEILEVNADAEVKVNNKVKVGKGVKVKNVFKDKVNNGLADSKKHN